MGRRNGKFSLVMQPGYTVDKNNIPKSIGLPYGTKPRLVMAFIASEAVKTRSKEIVLGRSLSEFMRQLDLTPTGGRWGTIPALREQMKRLFSSTISFHYDDGNAKISGGFKRKWIISHGRTLLHFRQPKTTFTQTNCRDGRIDYCLSTTRKFI